MKLNCYSLIAALGLSCILCLQAGAEDNRIAIDIPIVGEGGTGKISMSLRGLKVGKGAAEKQFYSVLKADLTRSGWFAVVDKPTATVLVNGSCSLSGGRLSAACEVKNGNSGRRYLSRGFTEKPTRSRALAHAVADAIVEAVKKVPGIASSRIVLIGSKGGKKDLFICGSDGEDIKQLTRDGTPCLSPSWGPKAESLYYTSFHRGYPDVYKVHLATGQRSRLVSYPGINAGADLSQNGQSMALALSKDGNPELYVRDMRSDRLTRLTKTKFAAEASPSWSPDGKRIAFVSDSTGSPQIYIISSSGGKAKRVTFRGNENVSPDWGPDGRIAYSSRRQGRYHICVMDPDKKTDAQVTSDYVDHESPSWAPDSRHIVFARTEGYRSDVYVLDTLGDAQVRLTQFQGDWYAPCWAPQ
jgi:TolB protein